jgi:probable HAF family extracellular repeat protein
MRSEGDWQKGSAMSRRSSSFLLHVLFAVGLATAMIVPAANAAAPTFTIQSLGTLSTVNPSSAAVAMNAAGQIMGNSRTDTAGVSHAFIWDATNGMQDLGDLGTGDLPSQGVALNEVGDVAGGACLNSACSRERAFLWTPSGGMRNLGTLAGNGPVHQSFAHDLNDDDLVVGQSYTQAQDLHGFVWQAGKGMTDIGTLLGSPTGGTSDARAVNDAGQVVGSSTTSSGQTHPFIWDATNGMRDLGLPPGRTFGVAEFINASGMVVGHFDDPNGFGRVFVWDETHGMTDIGTFDDENIGAEGVTDGGVVFGAADVSRTRVHPFIWTRSGGLQDLGTLGGDEGIAEAMNDSGQVVGDDLIAPDNGDPNQSQAFIWDSTNGMRELGPLDDSSASAVGIDASGVIAGTSADSTGSSRAVRWVPNAAHVPVVVNVTDDGYSPALALPDQGQRVKWIFRSSTPHSATDLIGLGAGRAPLFDSGARSTGSYGFKFTSAGIYPYGSTVSGDSAHTFTGAAAVSIRLESATGQVDDPVTIRWSTGRVSGYVFDVKVRARPTGTSKWGPWSLWRGGVAQAWDTFTPTQTGAYQFIARIRNADTGRASLYSPKALLKVTP